MNCIFIRTLILILSASPLVAGQHWVDAANGDNANGGTSPQDAWGSITFALGSVPDDSTIFVLPGIYGSANGEVFPLLITEHSLIGIGGSDVTILTGNNNSCCLIRFTAVSAGVISEEALVEGFSIENTLIGITGLLACKVTLRDLQLRVFANALFFDGIFFFPCLLELELDNVHTVGANFNGFGFSLNTQAGSSSDVVVRNSSFRDHEVGISIVDEDGAIGHYEIERSLFSGNGGSGALVGFMHTSGLADEIEITDSVFVDNGVGLRLGEAFQRSVRGCTIANNATMGLSTNPAVIEDCIIWSNGSNSFGSSLVQNTNLEDPSFAGQGGNISDDPQFRDPASGDYRLTFGSPSIDQLAAVPFSLDFAGVARTVDGDLDTEVFSDHGAYEFQTLELVGEPTLGSTVHLNHWAEPGTHGLLLFALDLLPQPLFTRFGLLELDPSQTVALARLHFSPTGLASFPFSIPDLPVLVGTEVHFQSNVRSSAAPSAFALTDRATLVVEP